MKPFDNGRVKWPYVTHRMSPAEVGGILPPIEETLPGSLLLARVVTIRKHKDLENHGGRRMSLFPGDVFVGCLGNRYATDQFEGLARCSGTFGHILGIGGVCGEVLSMNTRMLEPTDIEWIGRLAGGDGRPLHLSQFRLPPLSPVSEVPPTTIVSVGASMNAGKTTTAAQIIHSLTVAGYRVAAAKITGTACRKDPNLLADAGAIAVMDFTDAGWPSTAGCSREELLDVAARVRGAVGAVSPEFVVLEIADGVAQRETTLLLEDPAFRQSIDIVTFSGPDALSCEAGVGRLQGLGYEVLTTAGPVANGRLGVAEAEEACGLPCTPGESILAGTLVPPLAELRRRRVADPGGRDAGAPLDRRLGQARAAVPRRVAGRARAAAS